MSTTFNMPKRKRNADKLARVKARPDPAQWEKDETMTLIEAAALFFPHGPLTLNHRCVGQRPLGLLKSPKWQARI
jgi:hypothetical protein